MFLPKFYLLCNSNIQPVTSGTVIYLCLLSLLMVPNDEVHPFHMQ